MSCCGSTCNQCHHAVRLFAVWWLKHAAMSSCVVMFMAIFSADSSMVRIWFDVVSTTGVSNSQDDVSITSPPTHLDNVSYRQWRHARKACDRNHPVSEFDSLVVRMDSTWTHQIAFWRHEYRNMTSYSCFMWSAVRMPFMRVLALCLHVSLNQRHRGGARRLGNGLQNRFKRVRLPSPCPINIIWWYYHET